MKVEPPLTNLYFDTKYNCGISNSLGLMEFQFHLNYNSSKLNTWTLDPLRLAGILPPEKKKKPEQLSATSLSQMRPERQDVKDETPDPINGNILYTLYPSY